MRHTAVGTALDHAVVRALQAVRTLEFPLYLSCCSSSSRGDVLLAVEIWSGGSLLVVIYGRWENPGRTCVATSMASSNSSGPREIRSLSVWVANYYSARNPLRLSSLVILGVVASVVRQTDGALFSARLARVTLARMSDAFFVQMNGLGASLC